MSVEVSTDQSKTGKRIKAQIHCPVNGCLYFSGSERFFTGKKFLNQHIAKVHAEKKYPCSKCQKSFGMDWWRKHHEKTCGMEWKCDCGVKYASRETLLTHCRRSDHKPSDHAISSDKMKQSKTSKKPIDNPVIVLIQPIIQNLTCIQPVQNSALKPRPILSKVVQPLPLPISTDAGSNLCNPTYISAIPHPATENFVFSHMTSNHSTDTLTNPFLPATNPSTEITRDNTPKQTLCTTATQTTDTFEYPRKTRESRASQCSRRKSKAATVGIESIHTQTAESAVVKIKKKRSRRKSVAITTESTMLADPDVNFGHSVWSGFKDLIIPSSEISNQRAFKNCASTQTSSNKVLCDSQTLTDDELFKIVFDEAVKKDSGDGCPTAFDMLPDMNAADSITMIRQDLMQDKSLDMLNMFSSNSGAVDSILNSDIEHHGGMVVENDLIPAQSVTANEGLPEQTSSIFQPFPDCSKPDIDAKIPPTLSDIHTQTIASTVLDYNLLANMETQTTDDFTLYDLEFSDTETQTPWEDFPNIDDPLLQADQLSIEIQTDFPSLNSGYNQDPYDFINGLNICGECPNKETSGVNIETQTQDLFTFPQFTNSECQTLDLSHFMFPSTQTD